MGLTRIPLPPRCLLAKIFKFKSRERASTQRLYALLGARPVLFLFPRLLTVPWPDPRTESGGVWNIAGRVGSGQEMSEISRIGTGRLRELFRFHGSHHTLTRALPRETARTVNCHDHVYEINRRLKFAADANMSTSLRVYFPIARINQGAHCYHYWYY